MSVLLEIKKEIVEKLQAAVGAGEISVDDLTMPPSPDMGDLAFPCFAFAKELKKSPQDIATEIVKALETGGVIKEAKTEGAYVNLVLNEEVFGADLFAAIKKEQDAYGKASAQEGEPVMIEYAQPNTHKAIHVGHLRNFLVGQAVVEVAKASGQNVQPISYINDLGRHVALTLWGLKGQDVKEIDPKDRIAFLARIYAEASQAAKDNEEAEKEVSEIFQALEKGEGEHLELWKETREWSIEYFGKLFDELGLTFDKTYYESELMTRSHEIIEDLKQKEIAILSEGAYIVDLEEEKLGVNLLVRSDGTLLYNAKDLALALQKEDDFYPARSVYVIDARQSLAMKQLFTTLKKMGFEKQLEHLSYEFVTTKDGAMASRKGNVILYEDFRDEMIEMAKKETATRHPEWEEEKVEEVARAIAFGALRFGMLKQDLDKKIVFDMQEALAFEGFTGPYLLYTYARTQSILKKAEGAESSQTAATLKSKEERALLMKLAQFEDEVLLTGKTFHIAGLAHYLFDLAKTFSRFYNEHSVLQAEEAVLEERLALVESTAQVLKNGLQLLGMDVIEEM